MFRVVHDPIDPGCLRSDAAGGYVTFEGRVRNHNEGRDVLAVEYEAFAEMAESEGEGILREAVERFGLEAAEAAHRVGRLEVGDTAVWIGTAAAHRGEAFAACEHIIDAVKHRLPIWKKEHYVDGSTDWVHCSHGPTGLTEQAYYSRQLLLTQIGGEGQERLRRASVLVVGAGGLGASALLQLAAAGVGRIGVCEPDVLDPSNLHRQVIYRARDLGRPKCELAARAVRELNPFIRVDELPIAVDIRSAERIVSDYDVVLDCTDNFATKFLLSDACVRTGRVLVQAAIYQFEGQLLVVDPQTAAGCLRCLWPETPDSGCVGSCAEVGVLGAVPGLFGVLQAAEAVKIIVGMGSTLAGSVLLVDLIGYGTQTLSRSRRADCPTCGAGRAPRPLEISVAEDLADYTLIDIRELDESERAPAPTNARWLSIPMSVFEHRLAELDTSTEYLLVCARGVRSARLAARLRESGRPNFTSLAGGIPAAARAARAGA